MSSKSRTRKKGVPEHSAVITNPQPGGDDQPRAVDQTAFERQSFETCSTVATLRRRIALALSAGGLAAWITLMLVLALRH